MKKYLVLALIVLCSGCVSSPCRPAINNQAMPVAAICAGEKAAIVYEHITPFAVYAAKKNNVEPVVSELPEPGAISLGWGDTVVEMMKTPGWPALMENAPEVGWSMAGVISAWMGNMYGIIPGLVGIPVRSFEKIMKDNYEMQKEVVKLETQLSAASILSGNQVEVKRIYLPETAKNIYVNDGALKIRANRESQNKELTEKP